MIVAAVIVTAVIVALIDGVSEKLQRGIHQLVHHWVVPEFSIHCLLTTIQLVLRPVRSRRNHQRRKLLLHSSNGTLDSGSQSLIPFLCKLLRVSTSLPFEARPATLRPNPTCGVSPAHTAILNTKLRDTEILASTTRLNDRRRPDDSGGNLETPVVSREDHIETLHSTSQLLVGLKSLVREQKHKVHLLGLEFCNDLPKALLNRQTPDTLPEQ
jgi:hypothetical protein